MGQGAMGAGLPYPEAGTRAADLRRLWRPAHLVRGELRGSLAAGRAGASRRARPLLRSDARPGLLAGGGAGASLVGLALRSGARVVLANQGKTPYDEAATLRVWTGIGEVIPPAVERVKRARGEQTNRS